MSPKDIALAAITAALTIAAVVWLFAEALLERA